MKLYKFRDSSSVHHQEFFTVHTAMLYVILKFHKWVRITSVYTCACYADSANP